LRRGRDRAREGGREGRRGCMYLRVDHRVEDGSEEADAGPGVEVVVGGREGEEELEHASSVEGPTDKGHAVPGTEGERGGGRRGGGGGGGGGGGRGGEEVDAWWVGGEGGREGGRVSKCVRHDDTCTHILLAPFVLPPLPPSLPPALPAGACRLSHLYSTMTL